MSGRGMRSPDTASDGAGLQIDRVDYWEETPRPLK